MEKEQMMKTISQFKDEIVNMTLDQLKAKKDELDEEVRRMMLDSDLVLKIAIVSSLIEEMEADTNGRA